MVTGSIGFLILQTSASATVMEYTRDIVRMFIAGDLYVSTKLYGNTQFLNEVPMAEFLD